MAKKAGFRRNSKTAVRAAAEKVAAQIPGATITEYQTDRYVAGVVVPAVDQARHGVATRAAGQAGLTPR
jgi:hypothetical protein